MADLRITKASLTSGAGALSHTAKVGPSQFDLISSRISQKVAADVKLPAMAKPSAQQTLAIENELKQQLQRTDATSPTEFFRGGMKTTRVEMDKLAGAVTKMPPQSAFSPFRERLNDLEQQFQKSGDLIQGINNMDPKSLLNVQMQLYQLSGNIELMSRLVEQTTSGVKTMLQVQI
jgi:hypothetical protein